jgi:hypothetical protein
MRKDEERARIVEMLASVTPGFDQTATSGKANIARAMLGSIEPKDAMLAVCACGWRGTFADINRLVYDSGPESWIRRAGRRGWSYPCPACDETIWRYYNEIN